MHPLFAVESVSKRIGMGGKQFFNFQISFRVNPKLLKERSAYVLKFQITFKSKRRRDHGWMQATIYYPQNLFRT